MKKSELYGCVGSVISGIVILLLLFFVFLPGLQTAEEEGILISFGDASDGAGSIATTARPSSQISPAKSEVKEELISQTEKSVVLNNTKKTTKNTQSEAESRYKNEQIASRQADDLIGGSFGTSSNEGSGATGGDNIAGNPVGRGNSGGNFWSLNGRSLLGSIPIPKYNLNEEGFITVEIQVNASGNVTGASVKKATMSDRSLRNAAVAAAKEARFTSGSGVAVGTITYYFKLK
ncbi:MAG: TonB family protein [Paludibacter sp.]|nr:TonB family protein [Paludibacter sp.]